MIEDDDDNSRDTAPLQHMAREREGFYISRTGLALAASILAAVAIGSFVWLSKADPPEQVAMLALAEAVKTERRTTVRISGFEYSPHLLTRGPGDSGGDSSFHFDRAFAKLKSAEKPSAPPGQRLVLARAYLARNGAGDASRARTILEEIAEGGDQPAEVDNDKGVALFQLENYQAAISSFNKALEKKPDLYEALFNRALAEEKLKLDAEAMADWELFIESSHDAKWKIEAQQNLDLLKNTAR